MLISRSAYPTPFFEWPDQYGIQRFSDSTGECIGTNATIEITSEPQPSGPFEIDETDPLGWGHTLVPGTSGDRLLQSSVALLPDLSSVPHAEVKACKAGRHRAGFLCPIPRVMESRRCVYDHHRRGSRQNNSTRNNKDKQCHNLRKPAFENTTT